MKKRIIYLAAICLTVFCFAGCGKEAAVAEEEPNVVLMDYMGIETGLSVREVTESDIDEVVAETVEKAGGVYIDAPEKTIEDGDKVIVHLTSDGSDFGDAEIVIGSSDYPKEFEEALKGLKQGDSTTATLEDENGGITYQLYVEGVLTSGEITDEFVQGLGIENVSTVTELRADIKKYLENQYQKEFNQSQKEKVAEIVVEGSTVKELPEALVLEFYDIINKNIELSMDFYKENGQEVTRADVLQEQMEADGFEGTEDEYIRKYAEENAKKHLVLDAIATKEGIRISDDEVYSAIADEWVNNREEYKTLLDFIGEYGTEQFRRNLTDEKVVELIAFNSKEGLRVVAVSTDKDIEEAVNGSSKEEP